ncbi:MAG: DoxX family protein [Patescibacteria group bacterium]
MIEKTSDSSRNIALLIARVIVGGIFVYSGWLKVADMAATVSMFNTMSIPAFLTYIVSYGELLGGLLLILGLWAEYATFFLAVVMVVAVYLTKPMGFAVYGMPLVTFSALVALLGSGAGKYVVPCKCDK